MRIFGNDKKANELEEHFNKLERIRNDVRTNKHYELHEGIMYHLAEFGEIEGHGIGAIIGGKYWEHFCASRTAHKALL